MTPTVVAFGAQVARLQSGDLGEHAQSSTSSSAMPGGGVYQQNLAADANNQAGLEVDWHGLLWAETRLP